MTKTQHTLKLSILQTIRQCQQVYFFIFLNLTEEMHFEVEV